MTYESVVSVANVTVRRNAALEHDIAGRFCKRCIGRQKIDSIRRAHEIAATAYFIFGPSAMHALESFGRADRGSNVKFNVVHLIRIGSITKAFTALATILLVERGTLNLDAPVATILDPPPYQNPWSDDHQV
ncbi:MAG: serine hydrolase domain-containing protein [Gammaproteobacteria bacterium]